MLGRSDDTQIFDRLIPWARRWYALTRQTSRSVLFRQDVFCPNTSCTVRSNMSSFMFHPRRKKSANSSFIWRPLSLSTVSKIHRLTQPHSSTVIGWSYNNLYSPRSLEVASSSKNPHQRRRYRWFVAPSLTILRPIVQVQMTVSEMIIQMYASPMMM